LAAQARRDPSLDHLDAAAGLFDRLARAFETPATLKLALALNSPLRAGGRRPCRRVPGRGLQRVMVEQLLGVELAGVDQLLDGTEVHLGIILGEDVVEAALRQPHVERHLAALEALHGDARAALLALLAAARGLAQARTDAATDADAALAGAGLSRSSLILIVMSCTRFRFCRACSSH
jgi:hypothetical protein